MAKKSTITEAIRLNTLRWFGHVQRMEENRIPPPPTPQEKYYI